ncbi:hypothetical protein ACFL09_06350, partial [Planctomycetota bacterium]
LALRADRQCRVTVNENGKDVAKLKNGKTVEGKLGAVRFKLSEGMMAIARKEVKAVEVTEGTEIEEWKPRDDTPKEPEPEPEEKLTPEQKEALAKNKEVYETYVEKADEAHSKDIEAFSRKHKSKWDGAVRQVDSYVKRIDSKLERRRTASRRSSSTSNNSRYRSEYDRLVETDHLEQDRRDLEKAKREVTKMKKVLKDGRKQIDEKDELRKKRVTSVAKGVRSEILSGNILVEEQMKKRYDAALAISSKSKKK